MTSIRGVLWSINSQTSLPVELGIENRTHRQYRTHTRIPETTKAGVQNSCLVSVISTSSEYESNITTENFDSLKP